MFTLEDKWLDILSVLIGSVENCLFAKPTMKITHLYIFLLFAL